ncbi:glycosyl hydrolase family 18 protein [Demequina capsici]|uniref:chitinase n=1 Tax=Demequina capsici TaxID=3075620 RepID=A0AA96JAH3_9MICO|nr:glycosyl hydrolase family 18 protein [Demequina sp. PMTSA13]WNM26983.1 glycosyl hydrolase family 18 protein [Demequina sp. PMTSA13]
MRRARSMVGAIALAVGMLIPTAAASTAQAHPQETAPVTVPMSTASCTAQEWDAASVYTGGAVVAHDGHTWTAGWWTQGEEPGTTGDWGVWREQGTCTGTGDPTDGATTPSDSGTCAAAWDAASVYTGGTQVSYGDHNWQARWWTQGETPSSGGSGVWADEGTCSAAATNPTEPTTEPTDPATDPTTPAAPGDGSARVVGYFTEWGIYGRDYQVKDVETSGSADELTHIVYAFGNVQNGECTIGDSYADYEKAYTADQSVDGVADTWDQDLRGNFNQLRKLKAMHPDLKVIWSFGGWTWSGGFTQAAADPAAFAESCYDLVEDPRWADVFDGIDIDWEYPNSCGNQCDASGYEAYPNLMKALRDRFGSDLVTSAITADGTDGGKIAAADYAGAASSVDFFMPMTYDYNGAFNPTGPTGPHSPLTSYTGQTVAGFDSATAIAKLKSLGIPSDKLLLGIGFYGRGWTGVTQEAAGGTATGPAPGTYEAGIEDYKVLKTSCPATGTVGGTAYAFCNGQWWSYDTPATISGKMSYVNQEDLGGAFFWELSGDTSDGELIHAIGSGLG